MAPEAFLRASFSKTLSSLRIAFLLAFLSLFLDLFVLAKYSLSSWRYPLNLRMANFVLIFLKVILRVSIEIGPRFTRMCNTMKKMLS